MMEYSDYPHLRTLVRINSFTNKWSDLYLDPYLMAQANFSLLLPETSYQRAVCVCLDCSICVINIFHGTDIFTVHSALRPTCPFVLLLGPATILPGPLRLGLFQHHLFC
jgi:hypothetical protein